MDVLRGEVITVGEVLILRRGLQLPAQADVLSIMKDLIVGDTHKKYSIRRQIAITCIHSFHLQAQVGVIVAVIGRFNQRAGNQQVILAVVIKGDMEGVEAGDGELVSCRTKKQSKQKKKRKRGEEERQ